MVSAVDSPPDLTTHDPTTPTSRKLTTWTKIKRERWMYLFTLPGLVFILLFMYVPLLGNVVAFQDYSPYTGFSGSPWVGFQNFIDLFADPDVATALRNTLIISFLQLILFFPAPIGLALLLNSVISGKLRRVIQSIVYLPHFIGWVILVSLWTTVLGGSGLLNGLLREYGLPSINIMANPTFFPFLMVLQDIWKNIGWGTIIFLAALTTIDDNLYEAAVVDGAGRWRRLWHVTLPGIRGVIILLLILRLGSILTVGFEQILLQQPAVGADAGQVLDTYVYFQGVLGGNWGLSTAVGLLKGVVGTAMVLGANKLAHKFGEPGIL